jgi:hypothetical protein
MHETTQSDTDCGPGLAEAVKGFTADQLRFITVRPFMRSDTEAAKAIGKARTTVAHWKNKAEVDRAIRLMAMDGAIVAAEILRRHLPGAALELADELDSNKVEVRHKAATQILDRAGVPTETKLSVEADVSTPAELVEAMRIVGQGTG